MLTKTFGNSVPVIQAPMAGVSTPQLAAEVCNAGGVGAVALGALSVDAARQALEQTRALTDRGFIANLFCHAPAARNAEREAGWLDSLRPEFSRFDATPPTQLAEIYQSFCQNKAMLELLLQARPAAVSFHFGLPPAAVISALRAAGIALFATATSKAEGHAIAEAGLDGIVAQGWDAGGHRGIFNPDEHDDRLNVPDLVRSVLPLGLPVIAAGAIMSRAQAKSAMDSGAAAVQCGTAFLLAPEAATSAAHRAALAQGKTTMTRAISGRPARGLENLFTKIPEGKVCAYPVAYDAGKALNAAALARGETGYGAFWAGTGAAMVVARPAAETLQSISP